LGDRNSHGQGLRPAGDPAWPAGPEPLGPLVAPGPQEAGAGHAGAMAWPADASGRPPSLAPDSAAARLPPARLSIRYLFPLKLAAGEKMPASIASTVPTHPT